MQEFVLPQQINYISLYQISLQSLQKGRWLTEEIPEKSGDFGR